MLVQLLVFGVSAYIGSKVFHYAKKSNKTASLPKKNNLLNRNLRSQQFDEISSEKDQRERNMMEQMMNRNIGIATSSLVLSTVGSLLYRPLALLSVPGSIFVGLPIHQKTYQSLKRGEVGTETLVSIVTIGGLLSGYYFIISFAVFLFSLSFKLLKKATEDSKTKLVDIFRKQPFYAWVITNGIEIQIAVKDLKTGQVVIVNGGEIIPVDGMITEGLANIDEHHLTGESRPNEKVQGDQVFASTIVLSGKIYVAVERTGNETTVAKIGKILNSTVEFKASTQLRAESLANKTVIPTLIVSGLAFPILGPLGSLAIVNAHFKDKMTIVAPISIMNFLNIASQKGILIKDGRTLDLLNQVDTIVFDKTGTLTEEQPQVGEIYPSVSYAKEEVLKWAAAAEQKQQHPIAKAILKAAQTLEIPNIDETEYKIGYGLTVKINNKWIRSGSLRFMELAKIHIPFHIRKIQAHCHEIGHSLILVAVDNIVIGAIELLPVVRSEVKKVISQLRQWPSIKTIYIISGDHEIPTQKLAQSLNIDRYFAETLPEQKAEIIEQLQNEGKFICYIGDGINDSIALKKSQVSISLRGASTVAIDTAQIVLMDGSLTQLISVFELAQDFHKNINVAFATVILPTIIGAGGVFFLHFGLIQTIFLNWVGLAAGVSNATLPLLKHKQLQKAK